MAGIVDLDGTLGDEAFVGINLNGLFTLMEFELREWTFDDFSRQQNAGVLAVAPVVSLEYVAEDRVDVEVSTVYDSEAYYSVSYREKGTIVWTVVDSVFRDDSEARKINRRAQPAGRIRVFNHCAQHSRCHPSDIGDLRSSQQHADRWNLLQCGITEGPLASCWGRPLIRCHRCCVYVGQ